jgi:hypothetical protein
LTELADMLALSARIGAARVEWRKVVAVAAELGDEELAAEVYIARAGILGAADRLEQLIENPLPEMEVA